MTTSQHLTHSQLATLVEAIDGPEKAFSSLLHLRECRRCRSRLVSDFPRDGSELVHEFNLDGRPGRERAALSVPEREEVPTSWFHGSARVATELVEALALSRDLECVDPARQRLALEARRFQTLGFAVHLLSESSRLWHESPTKACRLARLAVTVVSKLDPGAYPWGLTADLHCKALACLGNALRLMGRLREAESELTAALGWWVRGSSGNSRLRARILSLLAQLYRAQRRFPRALETAREARKLYRQSGDVRRVAWLFVVEASILGTEGNASGAVEVLRKVLGSFSRSIMGEAIYWVARQNLCHRLVEDDRLWEARRELHEVKRWAHQTGATLIAARLSWVEALLTGREGDTKGAALRLERVRDVFLSHGLPYDAALACLDLAGLHLRRGDVEAAQNLAGVLAPVFRATGIHREALASLRLLASALEEKSATAAQVEALYRQLTHQRRRETHD